jgi:hypothetical protein
MNVAKLIGSTARAVVDGTVQGTKSAAQGTTNFFTDIKKGYKQKDIDAKRVARSRATKIN